MEPTHSPCRLHFLTQNRPATGTRSEMGSRLYHHTHLPRGIVGLAPSSGYAAALAGARFPLSGHHGFAPVATIYRPLRGLWVVSFALLIPTLTGGATIFRPNGLFLQTQQFSKFNKKPVHQFFLTKTLNKCFPIFFISIGFQIFSDLKNHKKIIKSHQHDNN